MYCFVYCCLSFSPFSFWPLYCLSIFDLQVLTTRLVSSIYSLKIVIFNVFQFLTFNKNEIKSGLMFSTKTVCRSHKHCLYSFLHFAMGCVLLTFSDVLIILLVLLIVLTVQGNVLLHPDPRLEAVSRFVVSSNACKIRSQWALLLTIWCSDYVYRTGCDWIIIHYCIRWVEQHSWSHLEGVAVCSTFWNKIYPNKHKINPFFILSGISSVKNE